MQGKPETIALLNSASVLAFSAEQVLWAQSHVVKERGFRKLSKKLKEISRDIHHHRHEYIDRVLELEGVAEVGPLDQTKYSGDAAIDGYISGDHAMLLALAENYRGAHEQTLTDDPVTAHLFSQFLRCTEEYVAWLEKQADLIATLGLVNYLTTKVD